VFGLGPATPIYLAAGSTDMRKGFPAKNHGGKKSLTAQPEFLTRNYRIGTRYMFRCSVER